MGERSKTEDKFSRNASSIIPRELVTIFVIVSLALICNLFAFLPFGVAINQEDVVRVIQDRNIDPDVVQMFWARQMAEHNYAILTDTINRQTQLLISSPAGGAGDPAQNGTTSLLQAQELLRKIIETPLPFHISGLLDETEPYLEFINFTCVAILVFVLVPIRPNKMKLLPVRLSSRMPGILFFGVAYFIISAGPPIFTRYEFARTFHEGRRGFTFYNWDINPAAFIISQMEDFIIALMLVAFWLAWHECYVMWKKHAETAGNYVTSDSSVVLKRVEEVTVLFNQWQLNSVLLAVAFLPWSYFDWSYSHLSEGADARYVYMALIDHLTWIGSWVFLSAPFVTALARWYQFKRELLLHKRESKELNAELLSELEPVSSMQSLIASIGAAVTFILPLFGILHH